MKFKSLLFTLTICYSFSCFGQEKVSVLKPSYPPRIVSEGKIIPFKGKLKDKTILANEDGIMLTKDGLTRNVTTCSEYFRAIDDGFYAPTTVEIANESFFKSDCAQLHWFPKVKPASVSYIHEFRFNKNILTQLPPCFLFGDSYIYNQIAIGLKEGSSLSALDSSFKLTNLKPLKIEFETDWDTHSLEILGFGDFTGSGYEEMLVFHASHSKEGSYGSYQTYIFTKKQGDKVLRVAHNKGGWCENNMNVIFKGCSADQLQTTRLSAQKLSQAKKYNQSEKLLSDFYSKCYDSLGWPQQLWLISDLMINRYHLGEYDSCIILLEKEGIEKASEFDFEEKAKRAILHNKNLCLSRK